jgi:magnesium transporter
MLINCVAYQEGTKLADIPVEAISDYLARPGCFVWVALKDASDIELAVMQEEFGLHELAVEDARHGHQRPKIEEYGSMLFLVAHMPEWADGQIHVGELAVFAGPNFILSVRNGSRQDFLGVRKRCEEEPTLLRQGPGFVLYALLDAVVDRYFPIVDRLETELETIEADVFNRGAGRAIIQRLYELKQRVIVLRHAVAPLAEAMTRLTGGRVPLVCMHTQEYFRDVLDHLARLNISIDAIRETVVTVMQVNLSLVTIDESETTKRLAAWAGIFAVATAFAGIWGMNFEHMPELKWLWGYPAALATIAIACTLVYRRFKRVGWL